MSRIAAVALLTLLTNAVGAQAQSSNVFPLLDSISYESGGVRAWWGYLNNNPTTTSIVVGPDNFIQPGNPNRGQPRLFQPGRHRKVFSVLFTTANLHWHIGVHADTAVASWGPALALDGAAPLLDVQSGGEQRLLVTATQFIVHASGGAAVYSDAAGTVGARLAPGSGSWSVTSDENLKEDFTPVDGEDVLARLAALPISTWSYAAQGAGIRHMGPTAQDFHAAFGLGDSNTTISAVDADGVALAALQALERRTADLEAKLRHALEIMAAHGIDGVAPVTTSRLPGAAPPDVSTNETAPTRNASPDAAVLQSATSHAAASSAPPDTLLILQADDVTPLLLSSTTFDVIASAGAVFWSAPAFGVVLPPGAGSWSATSDRRSKIAFMPVETEQVLDAIRGMPVTRWRYITEPHGRAHMGTTAQHFRAAFGLGEDDRTISQVDADGVNLAGAQALLARTDTLQRNLEELMQRLQTLPALHAH